MASGQTCLKYNDVTIVGCLTRRFDELCQYDPTGTDLELHRFSVSVVGYVHGDASLTTVNTFPNLGGLSAAEQLVYVRKLLQQPRREFEMRMGCTVGSLSMDGGVTVLHVQPSGTDAPDDEIDRDNGPKPQTVNVTQVAADTIFRVEFSIELTLVALDRQSEDPRVLSHRWSCHDELDKNMFTTRTFSGRLRHDSTVDNSHEFRRWVVPPLQPGMRRERQSFNASADGLTLEYTFVDREVAFAPPAPATDWTIRHSEQLGEFGITSYGAIDVSLEGDRNVDKRRLMFIAAQVIEGKLITPAGGVADRNTNFKVLHYEVVDESGSNQSNRVHVSCRVERLKKGNEQIWQIVNELGEPIDETIVEGYDNNRSRGIREGEFLELEGAIPMLTAFTCLVNDAEKLEPGFCGLANFGDVVYPQCDLDLPETDVRVSADIPDEEDETLSEEHRTEGYYSHYEVTSHYSEDDGLVPMPIAADQSNSGNSDVEGEPTTAFVRLYPTQTYRTVRVRAERQENKPQLPDPKDDYEDADGVKYRLIRKKVVPQAPIRNADGSRRYILDAELQYATDRPVNTYRTGPLGYESDTLREVFDLSKDELFTLGDP